VAARSAADNGNAAEDAPAAVNGMFAMLRLALFGDLQAAGVKGGGCYILSTTMSGRNFQLSTSAALHEAPQLVYISVQCFVLCIADL
jgi:hypothetical protein